MLFKYRFQSIALAALLWGGWALGNPKPALAQSFSVLPIRVYLGGSAQSQELQITNESPNRQRFQLSVSAWEQNEQGEMQLSETQDVIAFPQLFEMAGGETRLLRVGTRVPPTTKERTYRVFIQQLPTPGTQGETPPPSQGVQLNLLVRVGIPIFVAPAQPIKDGKIDQLTVQKNKVSLVVSSTGNVHLLTSSIAIKGYDSAGKVMFQGDLGGGYILAGSRRNFQEELPQENCSAITSVGVEVQIDPEQGKPLNFTEKIETPNGVCK
ncbi:fimbria/pilus periplasmic chaperone [Ancylothrix sp. C2]|nr:fimbria/pilus periplasmic chaperone [Ancylothrix sp. D3o]